MLLVCISMILGKLLIIHCLTLSSLAFCLHLHVNCFYFFLFSYDDKVACQMILDKMGMKGYQVILLGPYNLICWQWCVGGSVLGKRNSEPCPTIFLNKCHPAFVYQYLIWFLTWWSIHCQTFAAKILYKTNKEHGYDGDALKYPTILRGLWSFWINFMLILVDYPGEKVSLNLKTK